MSDRSNVIERLGEARKDLLNTLGGLPAEKMTAPVMGDWSVKDILAHVACWEEQLLPDLRRVREGMTPALASFREAEVDRWNELLIGLRRSFPLEQVLSELGFYRQTLLEALDSLPDSAFTGSFVPATCAICVYHDRHHAADVRRWREKEGL